MAVVDISGLFLLYQIISDLTEISACDKRKGVSKPTKPYKTNEYSKMYAWTVSNKGIGL